jgi:ATP-dependent DNA helicase RecQ
LSKQRLTSVDLSADLTDYEARRLQDRAKLQSMIQYCQTTKCRTRFILEYFGEDEDPEWECGNCDSCDAMVRWREKNAAALAGA